MFLQAAAATPQLPFLELIKQAIRPCFFYIHQSGPLQVLHFNSSLPLVIGLCGVTSNHFLICRGHGRRKMSRGTIYHVSQTFSWTEPCDLVTFSPLWLYNNACLLTSYLFPTEKKFFSLSAGLNHQTMNVFSAVSIFLEGQSSIFCIWLERHLLCFTDLNLAVFTARRADTNTSCSLAGLLWLNWLFVFFYWMKNWISDVASRQPRPQTVES